MAFFPTNTGGLFDNMNIFGARQPDYLGGLLSPEELQKIQNQSLLQGVLGTQTATSALSGMQPTLGMAGEQFAAKNAPLYTGSTGMFDVGGTQNQILGGLGQQTAMGGGGYDPSLMGSVKRGIESDYGTLSDWAKANPMQALSTTGQMVQAVTPQEPQPVPQPAIPPITKGTYNTAPTLGQGPNEKVATRLQITPNQLQLYPSYFRGGY